MFSLFKSKWGNCKTKILDCQRHLLSNSMVEKKGKPTTFQKLTPIRNSELEIYEEALNFVFDNDDLKNIAVSGPYSAGKSSLIETYKDKYPKRSYLHISLAHFESSNLQNGDSTTNNEVLLEGKILNQLIHQIDSKKIPKTNFKVKSRAQLKGILINTFLSILFLLAIGHLLFFDKWGLFIATLSIDWLKGNLIWTSVNESLLLSGVICITIFGVALYSVIKTQKNRNIFKKLNLQGNEIEIFQDNEDSYFDKYLNEVLYLFENSDVDIIIFEDIDRFDVNQIFEKLREVNTLINSKRKLTKKAPVRFLYLLRDDIFVSKDRTKFFDFIIPVVPVLDGSNSYDQFIKHFKEGSILELFDAAFLQGLSLYIDDMRMLKNIYNEFIIYYSRVKSIELNSNNLLAIIAYKNIFPKDFNDLQLGSGFVFTIFDNKQKFIEQEIIKTDRQIDDLEEKVNFARYELIESLAELDALYLILNYRISSIAGNNTSAYKTRAELVKAMKENPTNISHVDGGYSRQLNIQTELDHLQENPEYQKRNEAIKNKNSTQIEKFKMEIRRLKKQKTIIQGKRLQKIITKDNVDDVFGVSYVNEIGQENKFEDIKSSPYFPLIKYLIRNGYIDETYSDYMTYFYENSLSKIDKNFLRSITDQTQKEYDYSLENPELVLSRLNISDFNQVEVLNFDLFSCLLNNNDKYNLHLNSFLELIISMKNFEFIKEFFERQNDREKFVEKMNKNWPSLFSELLTEGETTILQKCEYALGTLYYSTKDDILKVNENKALSNFISNTPSFLNINNPDIEKVLSGLSLIGVKFKSIDVDISNIELFASVYNEKLYQLSFENISLFLQSSYGFTKNEDFYQRNYSLINSQQNQPLLQYVNDNINHYVEILIKECEGSIKDDETEVIFLLNNADIEQINKKTYISYLKTKLHSIEEVDDKDLWSLLLNEELIEYTADNILNYFFHSAEDLDSILINFINRYSLNLEFNYDSINENFGEDSASRFFRSVVCGNGLSNNRYEKILRKFNRVYKTFSFPNIDEEKLQILIKLKIIRMSDDNLVFLREHYPETLLLFINNNINKYVDIITTENYILDEVITVLDEDIDDKYKLKLLGSLNDKLTIKNNNYSAKVRLHILENNFDGKDIEYLFSNYNNEVNAIKDKTEEILIEYIDGILEAEYSIPLSLLRKVLVSNALGVEEKKALFSHSLIDLNETEAIECLSTLQMNDFLGLFSMKRPKIEVNDLNKEILTRFREKNWITKFEVIPEETGFYRVYGRRLLNETKS